ncbi:MAG: phosphotransferase, partial [Actinomycetota bacterium]|nr:phosphotransferase [Actinomycetota bacterium]
GHRPVLAHGDFSPDQVLVDGSGIRIIDFDRIGTAERAADIGSFAAAEEVQDADPAARTDGAPKTRRLLEGYRQADGQVSPERVQLWAAYRMFRGSVEPFRDRAGDWPADIRWHLHRAQDLIA